MQNNGKLILVTGGARSGKSEFAENYIKAYTHKAAYLATAEILDREMQERVSLHQSRRTDGFWYNLEAPYDAENIIAELPSEVDGILFDCLTLYVSNLMYSKLDNLRFMEKVPLIHEAIDNLLVSCRDSGKTVVFVTNEVGLGIVPANKMAREYRDAVGWVNQQVAAACESVYLVVCGQPIDIKKLAFQLPKGEFCNEL